MQASIVAALSSDLGKVAQLVEQAGEALAADAAASVQVRRAALGGWGGAQPGWDVEPLLVVL